MASFNVGDVVHTASNPEVLMTVEDLQPTKDGYVIEGSVQCVWFGEETVKDAIFAPPPGFESSHLKRGIFKNDSLVKYKQKWDLGVSVCIAAQPKLQMTAAEYNGHKIRVTWFGEDSEFHSAWFHEDALVEYIEEEEVEEVD